MTFTDFALLALIPYHSDRLSVLQGMTVSQDDRDYGNNHGDEDGFETLAECEPSC
ncbi:hypothetical protein CEP53_015452, partial [Fusarium sp. AF-6]